MQTIDEGRINKLFSTEYDKMERYLSTDDNKAEFRVYYPWYLKKPPEWEVKLMSVVYILDHNTGELFECRVIRLDYNNVEGGRPYFVCREMRGMKI